MFLVGTCWVSYRLSFRFGKTLPCHRNILFRWISCRKFETWWSCNNGRLQACHATFEWSQAEVGCQWGGGTSCLCRSYHTKQGNHNQPISNLLAFLPYYSLKSWNSSCSLIFLHDNCFPGRFGDWDRIGCPH